MLGGMHLHLATRLGVTNKNQGVSVAGLRVQLAMLSQSYR